MNICTLRRGNSSGLLYLFESGKAEAAKREVAVIVLLLNVHGKHLYCHVGAVS